MNTTVRNVVNWSLTVLLSTLYALFFSSIPHYFFKDRDAYLTLYAEDFDYYLGLIRSIPTFLFTEPLYFYINKLLYVFQDASFTVQILIGIICFAVAFFSFRSKGILIGIVLLTLLFFNAQFFAMQLVVIRQGLGMAVILLCYRYVYNKPITLMAILLIIGLIHTSFYVVLLFVFASWAIDRWLKVTNFRVKIIYLTVFGIVINSFILLLSSMLGTKQDYSNFQNESSGAMFVLWFIVFVYLLVFKRDILAEGSLRFVYEFACVGLVIYLTSYFLSPVAGRIIGTFIPFIYLSLLYKCNERDFFFVLTIVLLNLYIFYNGGAEAFMRKPLPEMIEYINYRYLFL